MNHRIVSSIFSELTTKSQPKMKFIGTALLLSALFVAQASDDGDDGALDASSSTFRGGRALQEKAAKKTKSSSPRLDDKDTKTILVNNLMTRGDPEVVVLDTGKRGFKVILECRKDDDSDTRAAIRLIVDEIKPGEAPIDLVKNYGWKITGNNERDPPSIVKLDSSSTDRDREIRLIFADSGAKNNDPENTKVGLTYGDQLAKDNAAKEVSGTYAALFAPKEEFAVVYEGDANIVIADDKNGFDGTIANPIEDRGCFFGGVITYTK